MFALVLAALPGSAQKLLPWQSWIEKPVPEGTKSLADLFGLPWQNSGGKEGSLTVSDTPGPWGGTYFKFQVKIDHFNEAQYSMGWPSFEIRPNPPLDWSGFDAVQYWIRCETALDRPLDLRFILWSGGQGRINEQLPPFRAGPWVQVTHRIRDFPQMNAVDRVHFFLCESDYKHGDEMTFQIGGFQLCNLKKELSQLPPDSAAVGLWGGARADTGDQVVLLDSGTAQLPALLVIETTGQLALAADDDLQFRLHEVFSGQDTVRTAKLGQVVPAAQVTRVTTQIDVSSLPAGYYLAVADVMRGGTSLLGGRVGSDDFYIRRADESMTFTVLSIRTGMVMWVRDLLYGDVMCGTAIALPHVYDPLCKETYSEFIRLFARTTGKHTEGNEAGVTGLALAAEAFRKTGDADRCRFTEWLLEDSCNHMMSRMQAPSGAAITWTNELADEGIGKGGRTEAFGSYDSNQIGEWMRALVYALLYFKDSPEKRDYAVKLSAACKRAGDYLVAHALQDSDGVSGVMRHLRLNEGADGKVTQVTYHQEGRQCDVYLGRALSGLSYYAYALQTLGETVPEAWWPVLDNTVKWSEARMKPNGWFDWQCGDVVEGGCHTFLGNMYIGEGFFGCYLADRLAGRQESAQAAAAATKKAYRYLTDDCVIKGKKYEYPLEFWVGPYAYWLFAEYLDTIGPDPKFQDWLQVMDRRWSVERGWHDFLDRAPTGGCGRTTSNGMLAVSIVGYLGIKQMAEINRPLHWPLSSAP
ncbi:MAG: hypothetical protein A3K19_08050 [Lentisphaerae bacterium RIFOXYB12_FULL_65_16]|nr:MAG: hypothetical protein A3K18_28020 [Lentisphaerae bacterium RIFOXYA12_64_32]OGV84889.1 MAG: hypothetical protein A3K19_08050 [Lentisphaerae bacterium RIFOXYB12_FULL_65_16]